MHVLVGYISISRFHAVDSKNGSGADLIITVKLCQCSGHGECDFEHSLPDYTSSDTFQLTYCSCELQWTGEIIIILVVSTHVGLVSLSFVWTSPWHFLYWRQCYLAVPGDHCDEDFDACDSQPCLQLQECEDLDPQDHTIENGGYDCGDCPDGYNVSATKNKCQGTGQDKPITI